MDLEELKKYCATKKGAREDYPFDKETLVFKVGPKMFALVTRSNNPLMVNLKCDPGLARSLRDTYEAVKPGYHMNKTHWNTVAFDKTIPGEKLKWLIDHSYDLVFKGLSRSEKNKIEEA